MIRSPWPERTLFTHFGRWERGKVAEARCAQMRVRRGRYHLVNLGKPGESWLLFDLISDPGERKNVIQDHPEIARELRTAYDRW